MNKKIIGILFALIFMFSSILILSISLDDSEETIGGGDQDSTTDEIMDEIDEDLLEGDDEIEIGEMV
ncbi:unnamed protein product [marine sediment metagenome]|uniref:Uncharacterized protein n=1 Tax=marine sediment metagenome TaxID=412755 RepID=X1D048_9ZZZZ